MRKKSNKANQFFQLLLKILVVLAAVYFIVTKLTENEQLDFSFFLETLQKYKVFSAANISALVLLSFINWFLEIKKWQKLTSDLRENSTRRAAKESLASFTAAIFTPSRIGEYGAKSLFYPKPQRKKILFLNFLGNMTQLFTTFLFGIFGLLYLLTQLDLRFSYLNFAVVLSLTLFPFVFYRIMKKLKWKILGFSIEKLDRSFQNVSLEIRSTTLVYAVLRYLIFTHQFYFLLLVFNVELPYFLVISAVFSTYFLASLIPTMIIFDAVIKGGFAVWVFGYLQVPELVILVIVLTVWILNFGIPAFAGSYFVLRYKPQKKPLIS
ncbi:MAG TPA: hypothetical protein VFM60_03145 [Salinimicrobium sp.]|nr:hypothetical protein [Salinimicrobium sp.]